MNIVYTSPTNPLRESLENDLKFKNTGEKAALAGASDSAGDLLRKSETLEKPSDLLAPTDRVDISQDARALLAAEDTSAENDGNEGGKANINAGNINKNEDEEGGNSNVERLKRQIQEVQKKLAEAQQELAQATSEASSAEDATQAQAAQAQMQSAQQKVASLSSELQMLTSLLQEAVKAEAGM